MIIWLFENAGMVAFVTMFAIAACIPALLAEARRKKARLAKIEYELNVVREIITR